MASGKLLNMPPPGGRGKGGGGPIGPMGGLTPDTLDSLRVEQCQAPDCTGELFIKMYEYRVLSVVMGGPGYVMTEHTVCAKCGARLELPAGGGGGDSKPKKEEDKGDDSNKTKL